MLHQLTIKNFAIIDNITINFGEGFNIFTGETGAGKSIIIDALNILVGGRASSSVIRSGEQKSFIEGVFEPRVYEGLILEYLNDGEMLIVSREIDISGKSIAKINGRISNLSIVKEIMKNIIDIHSQHENQYLLDDSNHLKLLDSFIGTHETKEYSAYQSVYNEYRKLVKEKQELEKEQYNDEEVEMLTFQKQEIESLELIEGEIERLELSRKRIDELEKNHEKVMFVKEFFDSDSGIISSLYQVNKTLGTNNDPAFEKFAEKVKNHYYEIIEAYEEFKSEIDFLEYDEHRIETIQKRILDVNKIKRKYGNSYEEIKSRLSIITNKLVKYQNLEQDKAEIFKQLKLSKGKLDKSASELHAIRLNKAPLLEEAIKEQLQELYLEDANFKIDFKHIINPNINGYYDASFLISLNKGVPLNELTKVISGGEASRFMLALKVVFNSIFGLSTTVFDEIDTGLSGKVAHAVGQKMKNLSKTIQVICISHLPQVVALATKHYHVEKVVEENQTSTKVDVLSLSQKIIVLAEMLSNSKEPSVSAIENAKTLLNSN